MRTAVVGGVEMQLSGSCRSPPPAGLHLGARATRVAGPP
ncbi:hypothetical protein Ae706Ps2_2770 [Pseudonocardia sp. Ae706_Ps2]|nr:hypothetical protein Ae331Ps2_3167c [Pseudonocardia sp. Ae331_Ps2]OLM24337.1 hypothetical protein Ae706Ps2_2770 [Pseudonocardia sp. Ae706_Ps2]